MLQSAVFLYAPRKRDEVCALQPQLRPRNMFNYTLIRYVVALLWREQGFWGRRRRGRGGGGRGGGGEHLKTGPISNTRPKSAQIACCL